MPLLNITLEDGKTFGIINSITSGFGGTLGSIGIIIGFGVMMGQIFEVTGAAKRMAYTFLKLFGKGREEEALAFTGFLVSIPIFCDSGFVVLAPIAKALSKATKKSVIALGVSLAAGLVITHSLVPPTPGPLGVCGIFGIDVGFFILLAIVLALPMAIACIVYARLVLAKKYYWLLDDNDEPHAAPYQKPDYDGAFSMDMTGVPGTLESFMPLLLPIILILINTVASALGMKTGIMGVLIFLGQPIIAVGLGLIVAIFTLGNRLDRATALAEMEKGMMSAGIIMLVTGGGGALGQIIKDSGLGIFMAEGLSHTAIPIIILPLVISTAMRFIQGSGTGCHDNSCLHLRAHSDRGRCQPHARRDRMLRRLPLLRLLQRFLLLGRQPHHGCQRSQGSAADLVHHFHHRLGSRCCRDPHPEYFHALITGFVLACSADSMITSV